MNKTIYKLRAECSKDVLDLVALISDCELKKLDHLQINNSLIPDCVAEFASALSLTEIREVISKIEDGHMMKQTIQPIDTYTGERDYYIDYSPFIRACAYESVDTIRELFASDPSVIEDDYAIEVAIVDRRQDVIDFLLEVGFVPSEIHKLEAETFGMDLK